jgi:hypothetical protein
MHEKRFQYIFYADPAGNHDVVSLMLSALILNKRILIIFNREYLKKIK